MRDLIQGSTEWHLARVGKVTASRVGDAISMTKAGAPSAQRTAYMSELLCERLTGRPTEHFISRPMQWGIDQEPAARDAYEFLTGQKVEPVGFVDHPRIPMTGASPDGLVGNDGLVEFKCPSTFTHINTARTGEIDIKHIAQMQWQMLCTNRDWCDYVSFDPRMPARMQTWVQRVRADYSAMRDIEEQVEAFLADLDGAIKEMEACFG